MLLNRLPQNVDPLLRLRGHTGSGVLYNCGVPCQLLLKLRHQHAHVLVQSARRAVLCLCKCFLNRFAPPDLRRFQVIGKLPHATRAVEYALEYGADIMEMHLDSVHEGERVLLVDDLIATGGTAMAAVELLSQALAELVGAAFVVDLPELGGANRLRAAGVRVSTLVAFEGR